MLTTLVLASLGTLGYLSNAYHFSLLAEQLGLFYSALSTYYLGASLVCIAGIIGVIKNKVNYVKVYAYFYWWQLLIGFSLSIFFSIIAFYYDKDISVTMVISLGISCLIDLHFCLAVWAYYQKLKMEEKQSEIPNPDYVVYYTPVPAYAVSPPPAYDSVASSQIDEKTNVNNNTDQKSTTTVNVVESDGEPKK
nr:3318_t:CDS:2 [Entrophospora candida]